MTKKFDRIESQSSLRTLVTGAVKLLPGDLPTSSRSPSFQPSDFAIPSSTESAPGSRSPGPNQAPAAHLVVGAAGASMNEQVELALDQPALARSSK